MFRLEILTDHGDWVYRSWSKTQETADKKAEEMEDEGYQTRVLFEGKIVRESVGE